MNRSTLIAVGVFALLAVAYFATREPTVSVGVKKLAAPQVKADQVTAVELGGAFKAKLTRAGEAWQVADPASPDKKFAADAQQVKAVVDALADLKADDFITDKVERQAELEVDDAKGVKVTASGASGELLSVVVGKSGKSGGAYLRLAKSPEVFLTHGALGFVVKKDVAGFRQRAITVAKPEDVAKVSVAHPGGEALQLALDGAEWKLASPAPADFRFDPQAAKQLVGQFSALSAQGFSDGEADEALGLTLAAATVVEAELKDGKKVKLTFGTKKPDGAVPLRVDGDAQVYLVPAWQAEQLTKKVDGLRDLTLLKLDPEKVTQVTVQAGAKKAVVKKDASGWKLVEPKSPPAGFEYDAAQVPAVLQRLKGMRATKVAPSQVPDEKAGLAKPATVVELAVEGGPAQRLRFGGELGGGEVFVKGSADGLLYVTSTGEKASFDAAHELFKKPPPAPDWQNARGLEQLPPEIRKQLEAQLRQQQGH